MKTIFLFGEDKIVYRMDPAAVGDFDEILAKLAQQEFANVWGYRTFKAANGLTSNSAPSYVDLPFNLAMSPRGDMIYWGKIPGLIFDTKFAIVGSGGSSKLIPDFANEYTDTIQDKLFWTPEKVAFSSVGGSPVKLEILLAFVIPSRGQGVVGNYIVAHLVFRLVEEVTSGKRNNLGTFLPPIPNIFSDLKICMGHGWDAGVNSPKESIEDAVQRSIKWFYESKMNSHLVHDGVNRCEVARELFNWDLHKRQLATPTGHNPINKKASNYWMNGLPITSSSTDRF